MTFIDLGETYENAKEAEVAPEGPADLKCKSVELQQDGGKNSLLVMIEILDTPPSGGKYADIWHYIGLPQPEKDAAKDQEKGQKEGTTAMNKALFQKRFVHAFNVPMDGTRMNPNDIPGLTARLNLKQDEYDGRLKNVIVLPEIPKTAADSGAPTSRGPRRRAS